ncbi:hypothetical protein RFI_12810, partial [Reticulomyxa filosa]
YRNKPYFIFFAGDTAQAQEFATQVFGKDRVSYRPFLLKGNSLQGIIDAVVDLVTVSSFDAFISTPHSSYSEMSSLLGQPRRVLSSSLKQQQQQHSSSSSSSSSSFMFLSSIDTDEHWHSIPVNRPILPMMTHTDWEIQKLNRYMFGRAIDIDITHPQHQLFPLTPAVKSQIQYKTEHICKLQVSASMGWMGLFDGFKRAHCYRAQYHHPGTWFPVADKS